jgi:hypothetical protein
VITAAVHMVHVTLHQTRNSMLVPGAEDVLHVGVAVAA